MPAKTPLQLTESESGAAIALSRQCLDRLSLVTTFQFEFSETPRDALDAYDAVRTARTSMRGWARFLAALYGLFFLAGVPLAFIEGSQVPWWQVSIWFVIGGVISWRFIAKPALIRRSFRRVPVQAIWVELSDESITARVGDTEPVRRYWGELAGILPARRGLGIGFRDGTISWLPERVFTSPVHRVEVEAFVKSKLPEIDTAADAES